MTRKDKPGGTVRYGLPHRGRDRLFWMVAGVAFLGGVLLQLL